MSDRENNNLICFVFAYDKTIDNHVIHIYDEAIINRQITLVTCAYLSYVNVCHNISEFKRNIFKP